MDAPVFDRSTLQPGDVLLYGATGLVGWIISIKTWHPVAHCEIYIGQGESVASRNGIGVGRYPMREAELVRVRRPTLPVDLQEAMRWFATVNGEGYDWLGLLRFAKPSGHGSATKMFCSEFATRFYRAGGFAPFGDEDADAIAPCEFDSNSQFRLLWNHLGVSDDARTNA